MYQVVEPEPTDERIQKTRTELIIEILSVTEGYEHMLLTSVISLNNLSNTDLFNMWFQTVKNYKMIRVDYPRDEVYKIVLRKEQVSTALSHQEIYAKTKVLLTNKAICSQGANEAYLTELQGEVRGILSSVKALLGELAERELLEFFLQARNNK